MPPHVRRGGARGRSNTPRHAAQARADLSAGRSAPRTQGKFAAFDEFCKRLTLLLLSPSHRSRTLICRKFPIVGFGSVAGIRGAYRPTSNLRRLPERLQQHAERREKGSPSSRSLAGRLVKRALDRHADEPLVRNALALRLAAHRLQQLLGQSQTDRLVLRPHLEA